eukprot:10400898-Karenia_brevis.AAC.1
MRPDLVVPWLRAFDEQVARTGGSRNRTKTKVIFYATDACIQENYDKWRMGELSDLATVCTYESPVLTLGAMLGKSEAVHELMAEKVKVARVIHDKLASVQDAQIEHA